MNAGGVLKTCKSNGSEFRVQISVNQILCYNIFMNIDDLEVYKLSMNLIKPVDRLAGLVERHDRELAKCLRKTSRQISPSIHEGFSKRLSQNEFKRFLGISMGSSDEMITHLRQVIILEFPNVKDITCEALIEKYTILSKQLNVLISSIMSRSSKS